MIKREYSDELRAEIDESTGGVVWSRSIVVRCPRCKKEEQEIVFTTYNDPETDGVDPTCLAEENYFRDGIGEFCYPCAQKMYCEIVEVEKARPLTEMEEYYKRLLAPEEHEKIGQ
jgi:hypothetical protein